MLKEPNRLGYYIPQTPGLPPEQIEHTEEQPPHEPHPDQTYIDTAGEMPVVPQQRHSDTSNTLTRWHGGVPQEPMVKPENWHSGFPNPASHRGLSNEPPYWQDLQDDRKIEVRGFRFIIVGFALFGVVVAVIFFWKIVAAVLAMRIILS